MIILIEILILLSLGYVIGWAINNPAKAKAVWLEVTKKPEDPK